MRTRRTPLNAVLLMSDADRLRCPRSVLEASLGRLVPLIDFFLTAAGRESRPGDFGASTIIRMRTGPLHLGSFEPAVHVRVTCEPDIARALRPLFPSLN